MTQKHLNVSHEESARVVVDYELNHFAAYLVLTCGSPIIFTTTTTWKELLLDSEFQKYKSEWNLPIECSKLVNLKRTQAL